MTKKKDRSPLDHPELRKKRNDLKGFEEVIDMIGGNRFKNTKVRDPKLSENFELLNVLEDEQERLKKLQQFFTDKLKVKSEFEQIEKLIDKQLRYNKAQRDMIIGKSVLTHSTLIKKTSKMFDLAFSQD